MGPSNRLYRQGGRAYWGGKRRKEVIICSWNCKPSSWDEVVICVWECVVPLGEGVEEKETAERTRVCFFVLVFHRYSSAPPLVPLVVLGRKAVVCGCLRSFL